ncbi:MAG: thiamine phosphate synthase, partial [Alphaproteobacteria bacterium]
MKLPEPPVLLITDRTLARRPLEVVVEAALTGGCRWVLLRDKDLPPAARRPLLDRLLGLGARVGATVMVSGDP